MSMMMESSVQGNNGELMEISASPQEMAVKLASMKQQLGLVQQFFSEVMVPEHDYGVIPGTDKPTLLKPGAEKINELYGFAPTVKQVDEEAERDTGFYRARVTIALIHRRTGMVVAEGVGEANTHEGRYRWRWTPEWKLPKGIDTTALICEERKKKNSSETFLTYKIENDDPWSLWNTVLKMAKKRALIDATLSATRSSGLFTQDLEDLQEWAGGENNAGKNNQRTSGGYNNRRQQQSDQAGKCSDCGASITQAVLSYSEKHFNRPLCQKCQNKIKEAQAQGQQQDAGQTGDPDYQPPGSFSNGNGNGNGQIDFGGETY